jgi:hypothetical protein
MTGERRGESFVMAAEGTDPEMSFSTFLLGHLGEAPHPETGAAAVNLVLARQTVGLLSMLFLKTKGNLTSDEEQLFSSVLTDLRLRFVQKSGT